MPQALSREIERIEHSPFLPGDPYHPGPAERTPHHPIAGEQVRLGAVTSPASAAERVWAGWRVGGSAEQTAAADCLGEADGQTRWRVELPPFAKGERVVYRLHAANAEQELKTEEFEFEALGWRAAGAVESIQERDGEIVVTCAHALVQLSFVDEARLRVRVGAPEGSPLPSQGKAIYRVVEQGYDDRWIVETSKLRVTIEPHPYRLHVDDAQGHPILSGADSQLALLSDSQGRVWRISETFDSPRDEAFMGFGERFNALNQRGQTLDVNVYDQYKNQGKKTYIPVPFFLSSRGYGCYLDTPRYVEYDLATEDSDRWTYTADVSRASDAYLDYYILAGTPKEVLDGFTDLVGKPVLPPDWAFGPWMSGNEWNSQALVMSHVERTLAEEIPASVLVIEAWSDEATFYIWNDAQYESKPSHRPLRYQDLTFPANGKWPDPKGLIDYLHAHGIRVLLWQVPVMKHLDEPHAQHDLDESYMIERGYEVREASGEPYRIRPFWFHNGLALDLTNPEAREWWLAKREYLLEMGIDGFKTDGGEHLWGEALHFADGRTGAEMVNPYPRLSTGMYYQFAKDKRGQAITFSRAGFTGSQAFPCHWGGDQESTWNAFRASILAGLNAGICGLPFWGWDIGGFSGPIPSAELYLRSAAMSCFCPIMQYHSDYNQFRTPIIDRTPWNIQEQTGDADVIPIYRRFAQLRVELMPYILAEARKASASGVPLMRALPVEFPDDPVVYEFPYEYLFGDDLLVAPVVGEGATHQEVYLPAGEWKDFWTGEPHRGPERIDYPTPKEVIPVFTRGFTLARPPAR